MTDMGKGIPVSTFQVSQGLRKRKVSTFHLSQGLKGREDDGVAGIHHEVGAPGATSKPQAGPGAVRVHVAVVLAAGLVHVLLDAGGARRHVLLDAGGARRHVLAGSEVEGKDGSEVDST